MFGVVKVLYVMLVGVLPQLWLVFTLHWLL